MAMLPLLVGFVLLQSTGGASAPTIVPVDYSFTVPGPARMSIRDFVLTSDGVLILVSGPDENGSYSDRILITSYSGAVKQTIVLPLFRNTSGRVAISKGGQIAVLRRSIRDVVNLLLFDTTSGTSRIINADNAGAQGPVEIRFLDDSTLLAGAYDGIYSISLPGGEIHGLSERVDLDSPFAILPVSGQAANTIEFTPGHFRTLVYGRGFTVGRQVQSSEIAEIPQERIEGGAPVVYSADVTASGRIFCAIPGTRPEEGAIVELDGAGALKNRFLFRLPLMSPTLLRVSETKAAFSSFIENKIAVFRLP